MQTKFGFVGNSVPLFRLNDNQQYFSFVGVKEIYVHF